MTTERTLPSITEHYPGNVRNERYPLPTLRGNGNGNAQGTGGSREALPAELIVVWSASLYRQGLVPGLSGCVRDVIGDDDIIRQMEAERTPIRGQSYRSDPAPTMLASRSHETESLL